VRRKFSNTRLNEVRVWPVPGFPKYLIFYQYADNKIHALRVLYGAQDIPPLFEDD
jgi:plasmid stabilization system protein ParE